MAGHAPRESRIRRGEGADAPRKSIKGPQGDGKGGGWGNSRPSGGSRPEGPLNAS